MHKDPHDNFYIHKLAKKWWDFIMYSLPEGTNSLGVSKEKYKYINK